MRRHRFLLLLPVTGLIALLGGLAPSTASSHREAPAITADPLADTTDIYAFVSPDKPDTVTIIANWIPLEEPAGGPNFHKFGDDIRYEINIDNNGDAVDDIVYEFRFNSQIVNPNTFLYNTGPITPSGAHDFSSTFNERQTYTVARVDRGHRTVLASGLNTPPANIGPRSTPNYANLAKQAVYPLPGGGQVFAGPRDDPFWVDLGSIFDLGGLRPFNPAHLIPLSQEPGVDNVAGYNVHSIVLQVPITQLTYDKQPPRGLSDPKPNSVIGIYSETQRRKESVLKQKNNNVPDDHGPWVNVSRLGAPLVNEVVIPLGQKDKFNASEPEDDAQFLNNVLHPELAGLIPVLYGPAGITVPTGDRSDLVAVFLTGIPGLNQPPGVRPSEMLRLNTAIAPVAETNNANDVFGNENHLGILGNDTAGFPNGRRLGDDVVDIELRALAGATPFTPTFNKSPNNILGDGVNGNDVPYLAHFPYVPAPHSGYSHTHEVVGSTSTCCP